MTAGNWAMFVGASLLLALMPGPDIITVIVRSVTQGIRAGLAASLGFASGLIFHTTLAAAGVAALMAASPRALIAVRWLGAAYLLYLAARILLSPGGINLDAPNKNTARTLRSIFAQSVLMNILNPKVTLFFLSFLPGIVEKGGDGRWPPWLQTILLGATFAACTLLCFGAAALFAGSISRWLRQKPTAAPWLRWATAALFVTIAVWIALPLTSSSTPRSAPQCRPASAVCSSVHPRLLKPRSIAAALLLAALLPIAALADPDKPAPPPATQPAATQPATAPATPKPTGDYAVTNTLKIFGDGRWDPWSATPVTIDAEGKLLYVSRNNYTQVIEVATGKVVAEIDLGGGSTAGAIALVPEVGRGFITNKTDNSVAVFDLKTYALLGKIPVNGAPGAILYDAPSKRVLVSCDIPNSLVPFSPTIDLKTGKPDDPVELEGSPSGLVSDGLGMVYVNINDKDEVAVLDTREMRVAAAWPVAAWYRPMGIAIDRERNRIFIGCRSRVVILSSVDGHQLGDVTVGGNDAWVGQGAVTFFDGKIFASCGEGILAVVGQSPAGKFEVQQRAQIPPAAWSIALDPKTETFYIPAADPNAAAGRKRTAQGIKLVVVEKK